MAFRDVPQPPPAVQLLQRSLERQRIAHAYLFTGHQLDDLESLARTLAQALNCQNPVRKNGAAVDCCGRCLVCQKVEHGNHPDIHWIRPESKTRVITIDQMRELMKEIQLKPTEADYKVAVIVAADRLRHEAANAFLKTLEEPPARSVLILLTTEPQRMLETILSRCLRLSFSGAGPRRLPPEQMAWLATFSEMAALEQKSLLGRYRLLDVLLAKLGELNGGIEAALTARSPLQHYPDAEKDLVEKWETELAAAIEAEYRRQRAEWLTLLHWWLRDVWLLRLGITDPAEPTVPSPARTQEAAGDSPAARTPLLSFPDLAGTRQVADRVSTPDALENLQTVEQLQRRLYTNVQEALALEVGLLKLRL